MAALFTGGKDSMLSIIYASRTLGRGPDILVMTIPTLPTPNPHIENLAAVKRVAESMGMSLEVVRLERGAEASSLANHLRSRGVDVLVAGDISIEDHVKWHMDVCRMAGCRLLEPI